MAIGSTTYLQILERHARWPYGTTPTFVFSTKDDLAKPTRADIRIVQGPVRPVMDQMRAAAGERDVWIVGGGVLASQFADEGLIDELHVTVVATVLGSGTPTFADRLKQRLVLTDVRPGAVGNVEIRYRLEPTGK